MNYTIEHLIDGDQDVLSYYQNAKTRWLKILTENLSLNSDELAKVLSNEQFWFEKNCGGRWVGQEIMVVTGIVQFYTTARGFDDNRGKAKLVYEAFMKSYCSIEVKGAVEDVAKSYNLIEE